MKFKIGDKVRILDGSGIDGYTGRWTRDMEKHIGEIDVVDYHSSRPYGKTHYRLKNLPFIWDERGLELVEEAEQANKDLTSI